MLLAEARKEAVCRFQSAPGREAGRCADGLVGGGGDQGVSIRARP